jgi:RHS repeat-associated protein
MVWILFFRRSVRGLWALATSGAWRWQRIDVGTANTNRIYLADGLGSVVALTDTNQAITTEYDYQPFGVTTNTGAANKNTFKFTGREDDGTGLYYYRARYYQPVLGRFVGEDPLELLSGDINYFAYAANSPLSMTDPSGEDSVSVTFAAGWWGGTVTWTQNSLGGHNLTAGWAVGKRFSFQWNRGETTVFQGVAAQLGGEGGAKFLERVLKGVITGADVST